MTTPNRPAFMQNHPRSAEPTPRWIRVRLGNRLIADSRRAQLLIEYGPGRLPTYCLPPADILVPLHPLPPRDNMEWQEAELAIDGERIAGVARMLANPPAELAALRGLVTFDWSRARWFEEAEEVFVHARDPYKRVDVLQGERHLVVSLDGQILAETHRPRLLFETSLPVRYYLPARDVNLDLLTPLALTTACPYKGTANYWALAGDGKEKPIAWSYRQPIPECPKIAGLICFFNERVDTTLDGENLPRPITGWS